MSDREKVVLGFARAQEAGDRAERFGVEVGRGASGERFVRIALVRDVEDDLVTRGVEYAVQRDRKLDDTEVGREVSADGSGIRKDRVAQLGAELRQVLRRKSVHVMW